MANLSYEEAIVKVLLIKGAAFGFSSMNSGKIAGLGKWTGAKIYVIEYCSDHESEPDEYPEYFVHYTSGLFGASDGEEESYSPEDVPDEAKGLKYRLVEFDSSILSSEIQIVLEKLEAGVKRD